MKRCIACGAPLWETPLLTLDNMPASAQHLPDAQGVKEDRGLTLDLCQCMGCGLVQFDCEPVDYYRDVIRAGGFSGPRHGQQAGAYAAEHPAQGIGHPAVQQQGQDQQDDAHGQKSLEQALFLCAVHTESLLQY